MEDIFAFILFFQMFEFLCTMIQKMIVNIILVQCVAASLEESSLQFIADFFAYKGIRIITTVTCSTHDSQSLTKKFMSSGKFWTKSISPEEGKFLPHEENLERAVLHAGCYIHGVFLDYNCAENKNIFTKASDNQLLNASFNWLVWSTDNPSADMENANLNVDSEVTWATAETPEGPVTLYDLYKINYSWPLISTEAGQWHKDRGLVYSLPEFKYLRRGDLQGLLFSAAVAVTDTIAEDIEDRLTSPVDRHVDSIAKYNYALHRILAARFNFTMQLHATFSHGYSDSNGHFDGMMGKLQRREVELGITSLIMLPQRLPVVDFTGPTWEFRGSILFRHPRTIGTSYTLLKPFTKAVWWCTLLSWAVMMCTIQLVNWLESRREREDQETKKPDSDYSWGASLLTIFGAISEQGSEMESKWMTWRIVYLVTLVQVVLLNAYYGACMVSDLLQPPPRTIHTVRDLINSKLQIGYVDNRHNTEFFKEISDSMVKELYNKKMKSPRSSTPYSFPLDVAIQKLHKEPFGIHDEAIALYPIIEKTFNNDDKCAITEVELFTPSMTYTVIQKRSPYRKLLTYGFRKLWDHGIVARELVTWRPEPPMCQYLDKFYSVDMETVSVALIIFMFGIIIGSTILFMERLQDFKCIWKKKDG